MTRRATKRSIIGPSVNSPLVPTRVNSCPGALRRTANQGIEVADGFQGLARRHRDSSPLAFLIGLGMTHANSQPLFDQLAVGQLQRDGLGAVQRCGEAQR